MSDEGFHEIQLNGKQLVFLFMAATVVSVVIFLCGVMVGRGVRAERGAAASDAVAEMPAESAPAASPVESEPQQASNTAPAPGAAQPPTPPDTADTDVYKDLAEGVTPERLQPESVPAPSRSAEMLPAPKAEAPAPKAATPAPKAPPATVNLGPTEPGTYAVQLAALRERGEAEVIVKRLVAKGYQAYVLVPQPGAPPVYRVQVGRFQKRGDADKAAARLRREEQFKPFVTK